MNQWPMVKLGDVVSLRGESIVDFSSVNEFPFIGLEHMAEGGGVAASSSVEDFDPKSAKSLYRKGDLLFGRLRPNLRKVALADTDGICSTDITVLTPKQDINHRFLYFALLSHHFYCQVKNNVNGINLPRINAKRLLKLTIPLPPLDEQRRIARILNLIDLQRNAANNVISVILKELRASVFHQTSSSPGTEERRISEVCDLYGGASLPKGQPFDNTKNGLLLMKVSDMNKKGNERHIHSTAMHVPNIPETLPNSIAPAHTVVLPKRGAAIATNKKRLTTRYTMLDPNLIGVRSKTPTVDSVYLYEWFENFDLTTITSGSSIPQLNKKDLNPLLIPVPARTAMQDFTAANSKIDEIDQHVRDKLTLLEELHQSLATRAFAGQL